MSEVKEEKKEEIIKDGMLKLIKDSEAVALQAVDSAALVLKSGLDNAEALSVKVSDLLLDTTRRALSVGSLVGSDVCEVAKGMVKGTIHTASEVGSELKEFTCATIHGKTPAGKSEG